MNVAGARGLAGGVQAPTRPNQPRQAAAARPEIPNQGAAAEPDSPNLVVLGAQQVQVGVVRVQNERGELSHNVFDRSSALDALSIGIIGLSTEMREVVQRQLTLEFPISERLIVSEVSCYAQLLCLKLRHC